MSRTWWKSLLVSPTILGSALLIFDGTIQGLAAHSAIAQSQLPQGLMSAPPEAAEETKSPTANSSEVSTTPRLTTMKAIELDEPAVADLKIPVAGTISDREASKERLHQHGTLAKPHDVQQQSADPSSLVAQPAEISTPVTVTPPDSLADSSPTLEPTPADDTSIIEQIERYTNDSPTEEAIEQVTSVSQLSDVQPNDWAFEALRSLVERYGCIAGYPDGTFRGNRAMTRYEFAAGLNACLQQIERLIAASNAEFVSRDDLATLQRLTQEFEAELAAIETQVETLEGRVAFLEDVSFSTTTKLDGEVVLGLTGIFAGDSFFGEDVGDVEIFGARTRLNLDTSFTGEDLLRTRLQAFSLRTFTSRTSSYEGNLAFADEDANSDVQIDSLLYSFPIGQSTQVVIAANGGRANDFASTVNFLDGDGGSGALTRFGTRNPIYYLVEGSGIGIRRQLGKSLELSLGYLAGDAGNPRDGGGLFNGAYGALAQLVYKPSSRFQIGLTYINSYNRETLTGSPIANPRTFLLNLADQPISINVPGVPATPITFPANQPIPVGTIIPAGTGLPAGTTTNAPITLPFDITIPTPGPLPDITFPAGTVIPAGISFPVAVTLPIDLPLPAPITLPVDLTLPGTGIPIPPINFDGTVGELLSQPDFAGIPLGFDLNIPIVSNSYGIQLSWQASDRFVLGGWVGYTKTATLSTGNGLFSRGYIDTINGAITLAFPDLGKKGSLGGIIVGVEPYVLNSDIEVSQTLVDIADQAALNPALLPAAIALTNALPIVPLVNLFEDPNPDISLHLEAFYQYQLTDNISITPGVVIITSPGGNASNADLIIGTLRTTFRF